MPDPVLSVVVPAHRCANTIVDDVRAIEAVLRELEPAYEILVVVDGDDGGTHRAARALVSDRISVWFYAENSGKGHAVVTGMRHASGAIVGFIDAGGDIVPTVWVDLLDAMRRGADIAVASKTATGSHVSYPPIRRIYSLGFRLMTRALFRLDVGDTQTGAKAFRAEVVRRVGPCLLVKRFAFDVELLALARRWGFTRIVEVPVAIEHRFDSTVNVGDVFRVLWDTVAVWYRIYLRRYYDRLDPDERWTSLDTESPAVRLDRLTE